MAYSKEPDRLSPLKDALKSTDMPGGAWLLCGPESYLSEYYRTLVRKKVIPDPDMGFFDHIRLSGSDKSADFEESTRASRLSSVRTTKPREEASRSIPWLISGSI